MEQGVGDTSLISVYLEIPLLTEKYFWSGLNELYLPMQITG
jgi:hypothetical protein